MDQDQRAYRLAEAAAVLSAELSLPNLLQRIVELAAELTSARYGALGVLSPGATGIAEFITTGVSEETRQSIGRPPALRGLLGALVAGRRPLRVANIADDPRSTGFPPHHPPMRSFLGAPLIARGSVFGNIYLTEKQGATEFGVDDEQTLVVLAAQAGVAV